MQHSDELLRMAIVGYAKQREQIDAAVAELRGQIARKQPEAATDAEPRRNRMSAEGRARIGAATRKRWAKWRKQRQAA